MKPFLLILLFPAMSLAQPKVESKTYPWPQAISGHTTLLVNLDIRTSDSDGTHIPHPDQEELIIIKEGALVVTLGGQQERLGPGSIIYVMPGDDHVLAPISKTPCTYYVVKFKTDHVRESDKSSMSFAMDWNKLKYVPHDKGGRRDVCDKPTRLFERFEMHLTTLNPGLPSHDPHSHTPEEIILVKEGDVEMSLDDRKVKASTGDLIFIDSKIVHGLTNIGTTPATYYAFQWN
jgi:(S)-ureidoglycine aminohydrolase